MSGIVRIKIQSTWSDWRTQLADADEDIANKIYQKPFRLADGYQKIAVTKSEAMARYDWKEGIDVILTTVSGTRMTLQEKFLTFKDSTITFEEKKTSVAPGAWYYCTAQYYFVGYTRRYWDYKERRVLPNPVIDFQDYILVDLAALHRADENGEIAWEFNTNDKDNRRSSFRFIDFKKIPPGCVIYAAQSKLRPEQARMWGG